MQKALENRAWFRLTRLQRRADDCGEIADIFRNNSLKNGLLPIVIDEATHQWLLANPGAEIEIDLEAQQVRLPNGQSASFTIESFARYCLLSGVDELGFLLSKEADIARYEARRPA